MSGPAPTDSPSRKRLALEAVAYGALVLAVGAAFVALRVRKDGRRVLEANPRATPAEGTVPPVR